MRFKDLFDKGKCLVGLHRGEWLAAAPTSCNLTRICECCGFKQQKVEHTWLQWAFSADGSCRQTRSCRRCALEEERTTHTWAEASYTSEASCVQQQSCTRCGEVRAAPNRH